MTTLILMLVIIALSCIIYYLLSHRKSAASFYKNFLGSLGYEITVLFTDDPDKLNVPQGVKADTMKGGGVVIFHAA